MDAILKTEIKTDEMDELVGDKWNRGEELVRKVEKSYG